MTITVQLSGTPSPQHIIDIFETVQWRISYNDNFMQAKASDFPEDKRQSVDNPPPAKLTILSAMGDTLYVMEGNAYESIRWVATKWPEDEQAFSFLYYYIEDAPRDGVSNYEDSIPQINGIEAFSEKDYEFLTESVGFHFCDPIKSVYKAIGQPQRVTAHYVRGTYSEYRQNETAGAVAISKIFLYSQSRQETGGFFLSTRFLYN